MSTSQTRKDSPEDAEQGAGEQRTESYQAYDEAVAQAGTQLSASSTNRVAGSARQQVSARRIFALIDCNNFFVSCVRAFRPDLEGKPCVALSSNDGCVVARSNEAKALGVPMGAPAFKWRQFFKDHGVVQFSGNFELYGDMSRRITSILTTITPRIEIYSVDESFLDLSELNITDYTKWGAMVRERILQWTGLPVSIGIAPSKTLAKLASDRAKKEPDLGGVLDVASLAPKERRPYLERTPIKDVWGVGRRLSPRLRAEGINSAYKLSQLEPKRAQSMMGIHGRQMVSELNGMMCIPLQTVSKPVKSIANTRTFGQDTNQLHVLEAALSSFAAKTTQRLRASRQLAWQAGFFIATNRHKPGYQITVRKLRFNSPTADTGLITRTLVEELTRVFNPNSFYHRAGVRLDDFIPARSLQTDLFGQLNPKEHDEAMARMQAIDNLNERYGKHTLYFASEDLGHSWQPIRSIQMPRFTTQWSELPKARIR